MRVAVILTVWKRPRLLPSSLQLLEAQTDQDFFLFIVNNNEAIRPFVDEAAGRFSRTVEVVHNKTNEGPMGRWRLARKVREHYDYFIFIDDDQVFTQTTIATLKSEAAPGTISAWWAWRTGLKYWHRERCRPGEAATHVGVGLSIFPASVLDDRFFELPENYHLLDDMWASGYFAAKGGRLKASNVNAAMDEFDELALSPALIPEKEAFYRWLRTRYGFPKASIRVELKVRLKERWRRSRNRLRKHISR